MHAKTGATVGGKIRNITRTNVIVRTASSSSCKADLSTVKRDQDLGMLRRASPASAPTSAQSLARIESLHLGDHQRGQRSPAAAGAAACCHMCQRSCSAPGPNSRDADAVVRCCMQYLPQFQHARTVLQPHTRTCTPICSCTSSDTQSVRTSSSTTTQGSTVPSQDEIQHLGDHFPGDCRLILGPSGIPT